MKPKTKQDKGENVMSKNDTGVLRTLPKQEEQLPSSCFGRWIRKPVAHVLIVALIIAVLPNVGEAAWRDQSDDLPGFASGKVIVLLAVAAGALVGLVIYAKIKGKGEPKLQVEADSAKFKNIPRGQSTKKMVPVTNIMGDSVTVKRLSIDDNSGSFTIGEARQVPFTIAPGETFEIPITLSPNKKSGKAQLVIVASTPKFQKDAKKKIEMSYSSN
jgi:hypothetical protein